MKAFTCKILLIILRFQRIRALFQYRRLRRALKALPLSQNFLHCPETDVTQLHPHALPYHTQTARLMGMGAFFVNVRQDTRRTWREANVSVNQ